MKRRKSCERLCTCPECAELDLAYPGEGRQLAFPLLSEPKPRRRMIVPGTPSARRRNAHAS
jgi:hypothetical protein